MKSLGALIAAWSLALSGCAMGSGRTAWVGPASAPPDQLFERVRETLSSHEYAPIVVDEEHGEMVVEAHAGGGHTFQIGFYRDGWLRIVPAGPRVQYGTLWRMPEGLRREYYRLSELVETAIPLEASP